ncbi:MinD/ParA family protein [Caloramator australicus]|uniref:Flagellar synthesis regulator FleN n=1 Tax=Caloramator australicus RC3 TaxID=857293 RepID=I7LFM4_9CLOT|nr:MinD/ParA family protein [Caloramator australicus]CCJ32615.1 Flagellar synthesis regulator FleN [Caloramator australicus RC3]
MDQAEKLRRLVNDKTAQKKNKFRVITVTSGKGGVGKSSFVVNLALALKLRGLKVAILDADIGMANVDIMYGVKSKYSLFDLVFNNKNINEIIEMTQEGIKIIPGGSGLKDIVDLNEEQRVRLIKEFEKLDDIDILIVDTGAGVSKTILNFVAISDEVIVITTPEPTALTDAYSLIKIIKNKFQDANINVVINKVRNIKEARETFEKLSNTVNVFLKSKINYRGFLFEDKKVPISIIEQRPYLISFPKTEASMCIMKIASDVIGIEKENKNNTIKDVFFKLFGRMGLGS